METVHISIHIGIVEFAFQCL